MNIYWIISLFLSQTFSFSFNRTSQDFKNETELTSINDSVCIHDGNVYAAGVNFTTDNPCETCVCEPPNYKCNVHRCKSKLGCKTIHRADKCCPIYDCDCEKNGKIYRNGEKVDEVNPCKVCYCTGGQIKCVFVTCYLRGDCKAVYLEGKCCPKYENCPPLETKLLEPNAVTITDLTIEEVQMSEKGKKLQSHSLNGNSSKESVAMLEIIEIHPSNDIRPWMYEHFTKEPLNQTINATYTEIEYNTTEENTTGWNATEDFQTTQNATLLF